MGPRVGLLSTVGAALAASAVLVSTPAMAAVSHAPQAVSQVKYTWRSYGWYVVQSSCIAAGQHLVSIHVVLALQVSKTELIKRLLNRGLTSGRTDDINESVIGSRIEEYERKTAAVADYYHRFNKVAYIPGEGTVDEIFQALSKEIDSRQV